MIAARNPQPTQSFIKIAIRVTGVELMMNTLKTAIRLLGETEHDGGADAYRDPLAHPVLKGMSARELADLPFPRPAGIARRR